MANNQGYYYDDLNNYSLCPKWAPVLGFGGIVAAVVFASKFSHEKYVLVGGVTMAYIQNKDVVSYKIYAFLCCLFIWKMNMHA